MINFIKKFGLTFISLLLVKGIFLLGIYLGIFNKTGNYKIYYWIVFVVILICWVIYHIYDYFKVKNELNSDELNEKKLKGRIFSSYSWYEGCADPYIFQFILEIVWYIFLAIFAP